MLEIEPHKLLKSVTHSTCCETSLSKQNSKCNYLFSIMIKKSKKCNFLTKNLNFISQNNYLCKYFIVVFVCMCVLSRFSYVWLFTILWTISCQAPLSMGFSSQEDLRDLPNPWIKPTSLMSPAFTGGFFTASATWEAPCI